MQKQVSTVNGIVIIFAAAIIAFGGVFVYEYSFTKTPEIVSMSSTIQNAIAGQQTTTSTNNDLLASPVSGVAPLTIQFDRNSIGCASDINIEYGDGTSCSMANPDGSENCSVFTHTYQNPGTYAAKVYCYMSPYHEVGSITITVKN